MTTPDLAGLCERLRAKNYTREDWHEPYGAIDLPCDADDYGAEAFNRNPDGPEAAAAIESLVAENERMRKIAEGMSAAISWLDYPFIDNRTAAPELRSRIGFMMKDAETHRNALQGASDDR